MYEIRSEPTTLGGAIGIPSNGLRLLDRLGLYESILARGAETTSLVLHSLNGKNMGQMSTVSWSKAQTGFGYVRVKRSDVMEVLVDAVEKAGIPIFYNKNLVGIQETGDEITVSFSDGTEDTGDFLLACDGIHSAVRKLHVDPGCVPEYSGISNMFSLIPAEGLPPCASSLNDLNATLTSDGLLGLSPTNPDKSLLYWFFSKEVTIPASGDSRDGWEEHRKSEIQNWKSTLLDLFGNEENEWINMLRSVIQRTDVIKFYPIYKVPPGRPWSKGRCLLIGDAAHAMPPHASQGFSMALEDVFLFSKLLQSKCESIEDGLRTYEDRRKVRTESLLKTAEQNGSVRHKKTPWRLWATEIAITGGLWVYKTAGLEKLGLGQKPLAYDVDDEVF